MSFKMEKFCQIACLAKLIFQLNLLLEKECCWKWKWTVQLCPQWRGRFSELVYSFSLKNLIQVFVRSDIRHTEYRTSFSKTVWILYKTLRCNNTAFLMFFFLLSVNLLFSEIWSADQSTSGAPSRRDLKQESLRRRKITLFTFLSVF